MQKHESRSCPRTTWRFSTSFWGVHPSPNSQCGPKVRHPLGWWNLPWPTKDFLETLGQGQPFSASFRVTGARLFWVGTPGRTDDKSWVRLGHKTGHTGVLRYVCFGGSSGKLEGSIRRVKGTVTGVPSSSEGNNSGEGVLDGGGINTGACKGSARDILEEDTLQNACSTYYEPSSVF